jgi:hypothetical protein
MKNSAKKNAIAERDKLLKQERERVRNENTRIDDIAKKKAQQEKDERKQAKLKKANEKKAKKIKAQQEKDKREQAQLAKAERENDQLKKAKQENTKSSITNYFMKDGVDNIKERFRKFINEYGKHAKDPFTERDFKIIDKALIEKVIKKEFNASADASADANADASADANASAVPSANISIRTANAFIEVLGKTIKKKENVKELFDLNNIEIKPREVARIFDQYFKYGIKEKKIREHINLESKDNESENIEFIVNRFADISKDDLTELFNSMDENIEDDEKTKLYEKYFEDDKFKIEKLIELYK